MICADCSSRPGSRGLNGLGACRTYGGGASRGNVLNSVIIIKHSIEQVPAMVDDSGVTVVVEMW